MEIWSSDFLLITILFFFVAIAYSSVGHAGASGYSAVMAIVGVSPMLMRPTSLMLNIIVGSIGFYRFQRAGLVNFKKVLPFLVTSMPVAYWSAQLIIEKKYFYLALGVILLISGTSPDGKLVEAIELPKHKFFVGTQFHPEYKSRPLHPHPIFVEFLRSTL